MTNNTPTAKQRILLDVIGHIPPAWDLEITYPTLPEVTHRLDSLPELALTTAGGEHEIAVQAVITDEQVFHGYTVTTTYPEPAVLTAACRERYLTSLSHRELRSEGVHITHHPDAGPASDTAAGEARSLSAAASLAGYYADIVDIDAVSDDEDESRTLLAADD